MDPGDAAIACYRHFRRLPRFLPPLLDATAAASGRCRLRPLSPPSSTAASINRRRHRQPLLPSPPDAPIAAHHCRRPLLPPPPPSAATTAASGLYQRRSLPPPSSTAASIDRRHRRQLPPPPAMVDLGPPRPPRLVAEDLGTGAIPAEIAAILAVHSQTRQRSARDW